MSFQRLLELRIADLKNETMKSKSKVTDCQNMAIRDSLVESHMFTVNALRYNTHLLNVSKGISEVGTFQPIRSYLELEYFESEAEYENS